MPVVFRTAFFFFLIATALSGLAQLPTVQTIRGQVLDESSRYPVAGATITLRDGTGAVSDERGRFVIPAVALGRQTVVVTVQGYEPQLIADIMVTAGKEVFLSIAITEKVTTLREVAVTGSRRPSLNNEMVSVSGTAFNPGDTRRFAGAVGDPSRMITGVAGVVNADDSRNDIVVRGNSPAGLLWQLEGMDIPNPNHYGSLNTTGGPVSILNSNNLGKSDFITGAFPAQYGDAISSVFDLRMRNGNPDKSEYIGEISFTGFEAGAEGPISKKGGAAFIFNYRYSTVAILNKIGFNIGTGSGAPQYQDVNFKISIPLNKRNQVSFFGLGGPSKINFIGNDADTSRNENLYGNENENLLTRYFTGIAGATLETNFTAKTYGKLAVGVTRSTENVAIDSISTATRQAFRANENRNGTTRFSLVYYLSHKFGPKDNLVSGVNGTLYSFRLYALTIYGDNVSRVATIDQRNLTLLGQAYAQWKHRFTEDLSASVGLHYQQLSLNGSAALEPRAAVRYQVGRKSAISFGFGLHSQMQSPLVYFLRDRQAGQEVLTNKDLGFTRSRHLVLGYSIAPSPGLNLKAEVYHQSISKVPVDRFASGYSQLNEGADFNIPDRDSLVNRGSGRNYGVELTIEKNFNRDYYFLLTGSLFSSTYRGSDGIRRNTAFNLKYVFNALAGKEFTVHGIPGTFSANFRLSTLGGKYTSPVDVVASETSLFTVYDRTDRPYSIKQAPYFRADLKLGYRRNYRKSTLEAGIDLRNFTNHKNLFIQTYNRRTHSVVNQDQQGILPVPYFRFTF